MSEAEKWKVYVNTYKIGVKTTMSFIKICGLTLCAMQATLHINNRDNVNEFKQVASSIY